MQNMQALYLKRLQRSKIVSSPPDSLKREEIFSEKNQLSLREIEHSKNYSRYSDSVSLVKGSSKAKIKRSYSEEKLYSWDALDFDELKEKVDGM
jgi:hypothetical protein